MSVGAHARTASRNSGQHVGRTQRGETGLLALIALLTLALPAQTARAQAREPGRARLDGLWLAPRGCEPALLSEVTRILAIELAVTGPDRGRPPLRITLSCSGELVELQREDAERGAPDLAIELPALRSRDGGGALDTPSMSIVQHKAGAAARHERLDLSNTPSGLRARVIAIWIAEFVRGSSAPPRASAAIPTRPSAPSAPTLRMKLAALARLSAFRGDARWLGGAGVALTLHYASLALGVEFGMSTRRDSSALGEVRVSTYHLAPQASVGFSLATTTLRVGAGYAFGCARMRGHSEDAGAYGATLRGYWSAPLVSLAVEQALHEQVQLQLSGIVGWVQRAVVGEVARARDIAIAGLWSELRLGVAYRF